MLNGKSILVTGGTGSFGRKFVAGVLEAYQPRRLVVFSRDELKQHEMRLIHPDGPGTVMRYFVGDVRDFSRVRRAMREVDVVIHAAALKQVPSCEYNPMEAVKTNIMGARNVIDAAIENGVKKVIALSTDKAVNPINLYGATKLCMEKLVVQSNAYSGAGGTRFACVRYGNVVGSRGSVVPLFREQRATGCVTVTDQRMTRFWITLRQGVQFVLKCLELMRGGEVFVPKIPSMNIMELAQVIAPGCRVESIGIRPGEKLHEVLISEDEVRQTLELDDMYIIEPAHPWWTMETPAEARRMADGLRYSSDSNPWQLSRDELAAMLAEVDRDES